MCNASRESFECSSISLGSSNELSIRCVPTQTQIRQQLGSKLSDVFFEYVGKEGKTYLGLQPPMEGPDTIWVDPETRLNNNVRCTPTPDPKVLYLKVFTHETILELGEEYIQKLRNQYRLEMEEALRAQAKELEKECLRKMDELTFKKLNEENLRCRKVVATLMEHFDACFKDLADTMQLRLRKECQLRIEDERAEVAAYMLSILQDEVERRDLELCEEFHDILYSELNVLAARYIKQINDEREVAVQLMRETVRNYEKMLQDLRVQMEINNTVDVCGAITQERLACRESAKRTSEETRAREAEYKKYIQELKAENCTLRKMSSERQKRLMQWKKKVRELLYEFQRYVNFALKSVPAQSEFMLNMQNLMLRDYPEDSFLQPEDYLRYKNCIKGKLPADDPIPPKPEVCCSSTESLKTASSKEIDSGAKTPSYCQKDGIKPGFTFDYDQFKAMLKRKYAADLVLPKPQRKCRKPVCMWKKRAKEILINKSCELYQMMFLAGEEEKEHLAPVDCFLHERLTAIRKICQDDPEFATSILGCSEK